MANMEKEYYSSSKYDEEIDSVLSGLTERVRFGWSFVRSLGELQVLTRASYIMLIVVPLLAGLWPGVTVVVNRYNDSVQTATQKLEIASGKLDVFVSKYKDTIETAPVIQEITNSLSSDIKLVQESVRNTSIESSEMPDVWVWVFLSALCAILGHTAYQTGAPLIVRQASIREYISSRIDEEMKIRGDGDHLREVVLEAREEYQYSSRMRMPIAVISMLLYVASLIMIGIVVESQTRNVLIAAGWITT